MEVQLSLVLSHWVRDGLQDVHVPLVVWIVSDEIVGILVSWGVSHVVLDSFLHHCLRNLSLEAVVSGIVEFVTFVSSSLSIDIHVWNSGLEVIVGKEVMVLLDLVDHGFFLSLTSIFNRIWSPWSSSMTWFSLRWTSNNFSPGRGLMGKIVQVLELVNIINLIEVDQS